MAGKGGEERSMIRVTLRPDESLEKMLKRFKKRCEKEGLIRDIKRASVYEKPSERRRRKLRKLQKKFLKMRMMQGELP